MAVNVSCGRFEAEALERIERGEGLEAHFGECPDCVAERADYDRLRAALAQMDEGVRAPEGWEQRVWARIGTQPVRSRAWWRIAAVPVLAGLAAAVALLVWWPGAGEPAITMEVLGSRTVASRGVAAKPGDVLRVKAAAGPFAFAEVRVYRGGDLVLRCGDGPGCARDGQKVAAEVTLTALGRYESLLFVSSAPLQLGGASMEDDLEAARRSGARAVPAAEPVHVY